MNMSAEIVASQSACHPNSKNSVREHTAMNYPKTNSQLLISLQYFRGVRRRTGRERLHIKFALRKHLGGSN